jgi:hypothetical protein
VGYIVAGRRKSFIALGRVYEYGEIDLGNHAFAPGKINQRQFVSLHGILFKGYQKETRDRSNLEFFDFIRGKMVEFPNETRNHSNLEVKPAQRTSLRLALTDKNKFGAKIVDRSDPDDLFGILDHQDELQKKFTCGRVIHCFLGGNGRDERRQMGYRGFVIKHR